jgi:hypothetical protein
MGVDIQAVTFDVPWQELGITYGFMAAYALGLARLTWGTLQAAPIPVRRWSLSGTSLFVGGGLLLALAVSLATATPFTPFEWVLILLTLGLIGYAGTRATVAFLISRHSRRAGAVPYLTSALLFCVIASLSFVFVRLAMVAVLLVVASGR